VNTSIGKLLCLEDESVPLPIMSNRKPSLSPNPANSRSIKGATISAEYIEAIGVLNEGALNQACELALDNTNLDVEPLLELFHKCDEALKVIKKQQPTVPTPAVMHPGAPSLNARAAPRGSLTKLNSKKAIAAKGVIPMRRTTLNKPKGPNRLARERRDGDFSSCKKARLSPPTVDPQAPPPSALNFLAKLNKDSKAENTKGKNFTKGV